MRKTILITGICGTFGKAFTKLLSKKYNVIGFDSCEWAVAEFEQEFPKIEVLLEDFSEWRFDQHPVDYLIHCAAFKHQPLGEKNVNSFIDNNIIKTRSLFAEAYKNGVEILFLSSDKSVEPCNLYGYTKAIGEYLCKRYGGSIARCGNVLNSTGSVIPRWEKEISEGKPLTLTDPEMTRFVIEADEAARQMWDWFYLGDKLIIPQMGKAVRLIDLAEQVFERHGIPKEEQRIVIVGARENEKKHEKLRWDKEETKI